MDYRLDSLNSKVVRLFKSKFKVLYFVISFGLLGGVVYLLLSSASNTALQYSTDPNTAVIQYLLPHIEDPISTTNLGNPDYSPFTLYGNGLLICGQGSSSNFTDFSGMVDANIAGLPTSTTLSPADMQDLLQRIFSTGFFNLKKEYFKLPVSEEQHLIRVSLTSADHYVYYYNDVSAPTAYTQTLNILQSQCQGVTTPYQAPAVKLQTLKDADSKGHQVFSQTSLNLSVVSPVNNGLSAADTAQSQAKANPQNVPTNATAPGEADHMITGSAAKTLIDQFASQNHQFIQRNGATYEIGVVPQLPYIKNTLPVNIASVRQAQMNSLGARIKSSIIPKAYASGAIPVRAVILLASDGGSTDTQNEATTLGQGVSNWYCGQVGSCYNYQGVSVIRGSQTESYYMTCHGTDPCVNDPLAAVLYNVSEKDAGTIYSAYVDTIVLTGWPTNELSFSNTCGLGLVGGNLAVKDLHIADETTAQNGQLFCEPGHGVAHELGHTFGLTHTCNGTLMDGNINGTPCKNGTLCDIAFGNEPTCTLDPTQAATLKTETQFFNVTYTPPTLPCPSTTLGINQILNNNSCLSSPSGQYVLDWSGAPSYTMRIVNNIAHTVVWSSNCGPGYLTIYPDGNLLQILDVIGLYNNHPHACWSSGTHNLGVDHLTLQDDGRLHLYNAAGTQIWNNINGIVVDPPHSIYAGQRLFPGEELFSPASSYRLVLQRDGNLVEYDSLGTRYWASGTSGTVSNLVVQGDGNLVMYDLSGNVMWTATTQGLGGNRLTVNDDGHFVVYANSATIDWYNTIGNFSGAGVISQFPSTLGINQSLYPDQQLVSPNRSYRLVVQINGGLAEYSRYNNVNPVWPYTPFAGVPPEHLTLRSDSELAYYSSRTYFNQLTWDAGISGMGSTVMWLGDDGNFGTSTSSQTVWSLYTGQYPFPGTLWVGNYLLPGQQMISPGHNYRMVLQTDGNLVIYNRNNQYSWASGTNGQCPAFLTVASWSNVVLRGCGGNDLWTSGTTGMGGNWIDIGDDGNFVENSNRDFSVWSIYTGQLFFPNVLYSGQYLYKGHQLLSAGHNYRLILQDDGNLVMYNIYNQAKWASCTNGIPMGYLVLQGDGNLVLRDVFGDTLTGECTYPPYLPSNTQGLFTNAAYIGDNGDINLYYFTGQLRWTLFRGRLF